LFIIPLIAIQPTQISVNFVINNLVDGLGLFFGILGLLFGITGLKKDEMKAPSILAILLGIEIAILFPALLVVEIYIVPTTVEPLAASVFLGNAGAIHHAGIHLARLFFGAFRG
jgi:glucan phosphoethanolaminetransferase (alkaline phosphatase superfamily)